MAENKTTELSEYLSNCIGKEIHFSITGFIECKLYFKNFNYKNENDILIITDNDENNYLKININQIYEIEKLQDEINICLDNDTIITIKR